MKVHAKTSEADMEEQLRECLKHASNKPGGSRFKVCSVLLLILFMQSRYQLISKRANGSSNFELHCIFKSEYKPLLGAI
jgi:hypothetical protein